MPRMKKVRVGGEAVRKFIIQNVQQHPRTIVSETARRFGISRQAVHKHIQNIVAGGFLQPTGSTRARVYKLSELTRWQQSYVNPHTLSEDSVWGNDVRALVGNLPDNVIQIWHYAFTELFNNVIDHSEATNAIVEFTATAATAEMSIYDNGVGIFRKIQAALRLEDERHAVLELAKGKFTTDPKRHSGEGIFFSSRMFDAFRILSGNVYFSHEFANEEDWILQSDHKSHGTLVLMRLHNHTSRTLRKVFDQFSVGDDYAFKKTVVPVRLAQYGDDALVSRSQARRLLTRVDRFSVVHFDFDGVASIGQAFADEVFRVFASAHPEIQISAVNANAEVKRMISRAKALDG